MARVPLAPTAPLLDGEFPDTVADGISSRLGYAVSLEVFEGPLDLLLHLVRRHELEILDIPIAFITEKYIEYLEIARGLDLEIAGEYLVMAATLAFLKSRELLPRDDEENTADGDDESGVDPREELIRRLIEFERFKMAGADLDSRPVLGRDVFLRGRDTDIAAIDPGLAPVTAFRLAQAFQRILERAKVEPTHDVVIEPVTIRQRMLQLADLLSRQERVDFFALFLTRSWSSERELRAMLVVTLMSVLELVKLGVIGVQQPTGDASSPDDDCLLFHLTVTTADLHHAIRGFRDDDDGDERDGSDSDDASPNPAAKGPETAELSRAESGLPVDAGPSSPATKSPGHGAAPAQPGPNSSEEGDDDR